MNIEDRVKELEEALKWYIEEDEINEGDPENLYWTEGKYRAMLLLGMTVEYPDWWLQNFDEK